MKQIHKNEFKLVIDKINNDVRKTQIKAIQQVNSELINLYYRIGEVLEENCKYGNSFIKKVSMELKLDNPNIKGFSERNLKYMKKFYLEYKGNVLVQRIVAHLPWRHNIVLMSKLKDNEIRKIYAEAAIKNGWSSDMLAMQIDSNYHLRIGNSSNNFRTSLSEINCDLANNTIKDPYIFDFYP